MILISIRSLKKSYFIVFLAVLFLPACASQYYGQENVVDSVIKPSHVWLIPKEIPNDYALWLELSADESLALIGYMHGAPVSILDTRRNLVLRKLETEGYTSDGAFSPDKEKVFLLENGYLLIYHTRSGKLLEFIEADGASLWAHPREEYLLIVQEFTDGTGLFRIDYSENRIRSQLVYRIDYVYRYLTDIWGDISSGLLTLTTDSKVYTLDMITYQMLQSMDIQSPLLRAERAVQNEDGSITYSDFHSSRIEMEYSDDYISVTSGSTNRDFYLTTGNNGFLHFDSKTGDIKKISRAVYASSYSSSGRYLVTLMGDTVILQDPETGVVLHRLFSAGARFGSYTFSRDESRLLAGGLEGQFVHWDLSTEAVLGKCVNDFVLSNLKLLKDESEVFIEAFKEKGYEQIDSSGILNLETLEFTRADWDDYKDNFIEKVELSENIRDYTFRMGGISQILDEKGDILLTLLSDHEGHWLAYTPEGYYDGNEGALEKLLFWSDGLRAYPIDQFGVMKQVDGLISTLNQ